MKEAKNHRTLYKGERLMMYVPAKGVFIAFETGAGSGLLPSDEKDGNVDYVNWCSYTLDLEDIFEPEFREYDGGLALFQRSTFDMPIGDIAEAVLKEASIDAKEPVAWIKEVQKGGSVCCI